MARARKSPYVRLTTLVAPEVADTYRRAAELSGKSVSQVIHEALEDHMAATCVEAEIASQVAGNNRSAATEAYIHLAQTMLEEAVQAIGAAAILDVEIAAAGMDRRAARDEAREQANSATEMVVRISAIKRSMRQSMPNEVALYDVHSEVNGRAYTFTVSIAEVLLDDRHGLSLDFRDDQHEQVFKWHPRFLSKIYDLVLAVFRKQEVIFPMILDEFGTYQA